MGFPILVRHHLYVESGPRSVNSSWWDILGINLRESCWIKHKLSSVLSQCWYGAGLQVLENDTNWILWPVNCGTWEQHSVWTEGPSISPSMSFFFFFFAMDYMDSHVCCPQRSLNLITHWDFSVSFELCCCWLCCYRFRADSRFAPSQWETALLL